ncbi:amphiregulin [Hemicordylus capensis]|uniref:amphiregulin n=1 Tax=Hemicordylus capensis TaxID=884348 RepID=UPI0023020330|nr:amphiregulin [Hemicordylus capensis]
MHRVTLFFLLPLFWGSVCQHAAGSGLNVTEGKQSMPVLRTLHTSGTEMSSSGAEDEETEEEDMRELMVPQFLLGDSSRAESQVKKPPKSESRKKNPDKPKRKGNKGKKTKKKSRTPCEREYKTFCVHGECKYNERLQQAACICDLHYFGERCVEQFLKTHRNDDAASHSSTVEVVVVVVLAVLGVIVIVLIVLRARRKYPKYGEKEERKKLRQENGSSSNDV